MSDLSCDHDLTPASLCEEWVAFSTQNSCELDFDNLNKFEGALRTKSRKIPTSRRAVTTVKGRGPKMYTKEDVSSM